MDRTQPAPVASLPPLDLLASPAVPREDDPHGLAPPWVGDPSSVPLPASDPEHGLSDVADELDRTIFAALLAP